MQAVCAPTKKRKADVGMMGSTGAKCSSGMDLMGMPSSAEEDEALEAAEAARTAAAGSRSGGKAPAMPRIRVGNRHLSMHTELVEMLDSTPLFAEGDWGSLRARLEDQGFLFVRGVIPPATIKAARMRMLTHLRDKGAMREGTNWEDAFIEYQKAWDVKQKALKGSSAKKHKAAASTGASMMMGGGASMGMTSAAAPSSAGGSGAKMIPGWTVDAESGGLVGGRESDDATAGWREIGNSRELTDVYDGAALKHFYTRLFERDADYASRPHLAARGVPPFSTLPACTWLRAKGPGEVTAEHADYYYFAKNTSIFGEYYSHSQGYELHQSKESKERDRKAQAMSDEEKETCQICRDPRDASSTLLCDLCGLGYHMSCLQPALTELPGDEQEFHCYQCQNAPLDFWTCWTALGDIAGLDGRLALIPASHRLQGYEDPVRADLLPKGFTRAFEMASIWQTPSRINMGDIILFNIKTIHAATRNGGERFRLSLDTRVTTCKGRAYRERYGITDLDQPPTATTNNVQQTTKSKSAAATTKLTGARATIAGAFKQQKKA